MKRIVFTIILLLILSCTGQKEFDFTVVDSQTSYDMTNWSSVKKNEYYRRSGKLNQDFLKYEKCKTPTFTEFRSVLKNDLKILVSKTDPFLITSHFLEPDNYNYLVIFPEHKNLSFGSELPLLDSASVEYYYSKDYRELYHKEDLNYLLNQLVFNPNSLNLDTLLAREWNQEFFQLMVCDYHFTREEKVLKHVIENLCSMVARPDQVDEQIFLRMFFERSMPKIDRTFVAKFEKYDKDRLMYNSFLKASKKKYPSEFETFQKELEELYDE